MKTLELIKWTTAIINDACMPTAYGSVNRHEQNLVNVT